MDSEPSRSSDNKITNTKGERNEGCGRKRAEKEQYNEEWHKRKGREVKVVA